MNEQSRVVGWDDEVVVTADDGREFRCHAELTGSNREWRWVFRSTDGAIIVGPPWWGPTTSGELQRLLNRWRETKPVTLSVMDGKGAAPRT